MSTPVAQRRTGVAGRSAGSSPCPSGAPTAAAAGPAPRRRRRPVDDERAVGRGGYGCGRRRDDGRRCRRMLAIAASCFNLMKAATSLT